MINQEQLVEVHILHQQRPPPYSPELNPIEQVLSWLRQYYIAKQSLINYHDTLLKVCRAWDGFLRSSFLENTDRVIKMYSRD